MIKNKSCDRCLFYGKNDTQALCECCTIFVETSENGLIKLDNNTMDIDVYEFFDETKYNCIKRWCQANNVRQIKEIPADICMLLSQVKGNGSTRILPSIERLSSLSKAEIGRFNGLMVNSTAPSLLERLQKCLQSSSVLGELPIINLWWNRNFFVANGHLKNMQINRIKELLTFKHEGFFFKNVAGMGSTKIVLFLNRLSEIVNAFEFVTGNALIEPEEVVNVFPFLNIRQECESFSLSFFPSAKLSGASLQRLKEKSCSELGHLKFVHRNDLEKLLTKEELEFINFVATKATISLEALLESYFINSQYERDIQIFVERAEGNILQEIGEKHQMTRERIRQIVRKAVKRYARVFINCLENIMEHKGHNYVGTDEILNTFSNDMLSLIFLFTIKNVDRFVYLDFAETFIDSDKFSDAGRSLFELAQKFVGKEINLREKNDEFEEYLEEHGYNFVEIPQIAELLCRNGYKRYGEYLTKGAVSYGYLLAKLVAEHYPNGIKINDDEATENLRQLFIENFGYRGLPKSARSMQARMADHLVLSGRGYAIAAESIEIDISVLEQIKQYIDNNKLSQISYYEIFKAHEGLLLMNTNIDNPYYLHGTFKKYFPSDYEYSRDYLRKKNEEGYEKLSDRIKLYVNNAKQSVRCDELMNVLNCSFMMLYSAVQNDNELIQWGSEFVNSIKNLIISTEDIDCMKDIINDSFEQNNGYCTQYFLFDKLTSIRKEFLDNNEIKSAEILKGIVLALLKNDFAISRIHIARKGLFDDLSNYGVLNQLFFNESELSYKTVVMFLEKLKWRPATIAATIYEVDKRFFRISDDIYVKNENIQICTDEMEQAFHALKDIIDDKDFMPSSWINRFDTFPVIAYQWNEFLLNSITGRKSWEYKQISPLVKDRRYNRAVFVRSDLNINTYEELVAFLLKKQELNNLSEKNMLNFLIINGLAIKSIPHELYSGDSIKFDGEIFTLI